MKFRRMPDFNQIVDKLSQYDNRSKYYNILNMGVTMKKRTMFIIFMVLMTGAFATTIYIPEDYATIQAGIDASEDGDEIIVSSGTYVENINSGVVVLYYAGYKLYFANDH